MCKLFVKIESVFEWIRAHPIKTLIVIAVGVGLAVAAFFLIKHFVMPLLVIAVAVWFLLECPIPPQFQPKEAPQVSAAALTNLMLETLTEVSSRIGIISPYDESSVLIFPQTTSKGGVPIYRYKAESAPNAIVDEEFLNKCRMIVQSRVSDRLNAGTITGISIPPCFYNGISSLYIDKVRASGHRLIFEVIFVSSDVARDYVLSESTSACEISADDLEL